MLSQKERMLGGTPKRSDPPEPRRIERVFRCDGTHPGKHGQTSLAVPPKSSRIRLNPYGPKAPTMPPTMSDDFAFAKE